MIHNINIFRRATLALAAALLTAATAWATTTSTINVGGTDYTLFTGFTATDGTAVNNAFVYGNAVDGQTSTSWHPQSSDTYVEFNTDDPIVPKGYIFNTYMEGYFYPNAWVLKAKANTTDDWTTLSSYSGQTLSSGQEFRYACSNDGNTAYKYFRFEASNSGNNIWLTEIRLYGSSPDVYYTHLTKKDATCTETGIKQDCYLRNDGKYFTDETGTTELAESDVIAPIIPHTGEHHEATDVNIEYWQCSMCGKYFSDEGYTTEITKEQTKIYRTITIDGSISGLVRVYFGYTQALAGETIALFVSDLIDASTLKVNNGAVELTAVTDIQYTFTMPAADVTVTADVAQSNADGDVLTGSIRHTVTITNGASITLNNATITGSIVCEGSATITLDGTNSVSVVQYNKAGIQIGGSGTTLTIRGDGSLTATGGSAAAGIGLGRTWDASVTAGAIVIEGGTVNASGDIGIGIGTVGNSQTATIDGISIKGGTVSASLGKGYIYNGSTATVGYIKIYDTIDMVDASKITETVTYMHVDGETATDVTASKTDYFTIGENGDRRIITPKDDTDYTITIADGIEHGTLTVAAATAKYMETVTVTATPAFGYRFVRLVVKDADGNDVASTVNTFQMPKGGATVSAVFEQGVHGTTEFAWGYFGPDGFVNEATIYDGVTTVNIQNTEVSYNILKYDEYTSSKFRLDNDTYEADIPYAGGTGEFYETGNATNFAFDDDGQTGYYDITLTDVGNGKWSVSIQKTAGQMDVVPDQTYTGSAITPEPLVIAGSLSLTKGTDYTYSYENNTDAGTATVRATFQGDYASLGYVEKTFTIAPWSGTGDLDDPYMIYNKDQLLLLAHRVNGTNDETANTYEGKYFKLGADITFTHPAVETDDYAENYEAIGTYIDGTYRYFNGDFDGDGHTVSGIRIRKTTGSSDYQGLFGLIDSGADIHDVHLTDARIKGYNSVGGIVGYNNEGYISGCSVTDSYITATDNLNYGTICGWNGGTLSNNYYHGCTVNSTAVTSGVGCHEADIADNNGALPAYAIALGANITTPPGTFAGQTGWLTTPPVDARLAPENGFTLAGNHYFASGYVFTPGSTLASGAAQGYTPRATLDGQLLALYTPTGDTDPLAGKAIARLTITADCDGKTLASTEAIYSTGQPVTVAYIKADGTTQTAQAVALDGYEAVDGDGDVCLDEGTYYVGTDITYANQIYLNGDVTLILADGKTMTLNGDTPGIINDSRNLTIYGQSLDDDAGTLRYNGTADGITVNNYEQYSGNVSITTIGSTIDSWVWGIDANDVTLLGGTLTVTANSTNAIAIMGGTHSILGGQLTATATGTDATGIYAGASSGTAITLGWTRPDDRITVSSISTPEGGTVAVADGQALTDGSGNIYTGTLTADDLAAIGGQTLQPCLALAITYNSGSDCVWTTCVAETDCTVPEGLTAYTVGQVTASEAVAEPVDYLPQGVPVLLCRTATATTSYTAVPCTVSKPFSGDNLLRVATEPTTVADGCAYVLYGDEFVLAAGGTLPAGVVYLPVGSGASSARRLVISHGTTAIADAPIARQTPAGQAPSSAGWYAVDGRRLDGQPTAKGLYIHGGKKVIVK